MAERGRVEEEVPRQWGKSLGLIDVRDRHIGWVGVNSFRDDEDGKLWNVEYGVPDPRVATGFPKVEIRTSLVKAKPWEILFDGVPRVVGLRWDGVDSDLGIIRRLSDDESLQRRLMGLGDLETIDESLRGEWDCLGSGAFRRLINNAGEAEVSYNSGRAYDPSDGAWGSAPSMAELRIGHTAVRLPSGDLLVAGGDNGTEFLASAEPYSAVAEEWSSTCYMVSC